MTRKIAGLVIAIGFFGWVGDAVDAYDRWASQYNITPTWNSRGIAIRPIPNPRAFGPGWSGRGNNNNDGRHPDRPAKERECCS